MSQNGTAIMGAGVRFWIIMGAGVRFWGDKRGILSRVSYCQGLSSDLVDITYRGWWWVSVEFEVAWADGEAWVAVLVFGGAGCGDAGWCGGLACGRVGRTRARQHMAGGGGRGASGSLAAKRVVAG